MLKSLRKGRQPAIAELAELLRLLNAAEEDHARPNEIRGARWAAFEELDGNEPLWRIPAMQRSCFKQLFLAENGLSCGIGRRE